MLLWGINPQATSPAQARRISRARNHGAKLIVIDPRKNNLAEKADCWLRVKPGMDGELAMAIHPITAQETVIADGEWIYLETRTGKVRLKAKYNSALHPKVVTTVYGWWQACDEPKLPGYDPFRSDGANTNLLIPNTDNDPISASVAHRGQHCCVTKL